MKLIFIRHGYSKSNEKGLFTGRTNVSLTQLGFIQAKKTAEFLAKNFSIDKIYSSPLKRARQTARPIADAFGLPVIIDYALCEIDGGKWEEKSAEQLMQLYPEDYSLWLTNIGLAHCTGGESMLQVQQRALNEVLRIAAENPGKTVALVTHAGVIRTQQCVWQNIPPELQN